MFDSASEFARELGVDTKTVISYIKKGEVKAHRAKNRKYYKIPERETNKIKKLRKPYEKWQTIWSKSEENLIIYSEHLQDKELAELLKRNINSVRIHKTIMRKKGLL